MAVKLVLAGLVVAGVVSYTLGLGPFATRLEAVAENQGKALFLGPQARCGVCHLVNAPPPPGQPPGAPPAPPQSRAPAPELPPASLPPLPPLASHCTTR